MEVTVPSIGGLFHSGRNFYSRQEGQIDYSKASKLVEEQSERVAGRLDEMASKIDDPRLDQARENLEHAASMKPARATRKPPSRRWTTSRKPKRLLAHGPQGSTSKIFANSISTRLWVLSTRVVASTPEPAGAAAFDNLAKTAQRAIDNNSGDFESHLDELRGKNFMILWRQDWFVIDRFKWLAEDAFLFPDASEHAELVPSAEALKANDIDKLRQVVSTSIPYESVRLVMTK